MKKVVRTIWISALSGLAFLAACCTTKGGLSKAERKQLIKERDSIQEVLSRREGATVYGTPEVMQRYSLETLRLRSQLDSINYKLGEDVDLEKSAQQYENQKKRMEEMMERERKRSDLSMRLEQLRNTIREREGSCVYGSPEVIEEYARETNRLKEQAFELEVELKEMEKGRP